jgi:hypothetical protein
MVLLLKDKHNLSSNDDTYDRKQQTYAKSNFIWNEMLVGHVAAVDCRNLPPELCVRPIRPENDVFPLAQVDARQRAMFAAIQKIWGDV